MDKKEFKKTFSNCAKKNGFEFLHGGWFKESEECIFVMDLQKSNFGENYYLNIKIYIQGSLGRTFVKSKDLILNVGNIFRRQPIEYNDFFNLEIPMDDETRKNGLELLFDDFITPFSVKLLTRSGIKELAEKDQLFLLPAIKKDLGLS